jgi:hypothetical protein
MKYLFLISTILLFFSCQKEEIQPNGEVLPPQPIITVIDSTEQAPNLEGQTWVITGYRVGEIGNMISVYDTLKFTTLTQYTYNGNQSPYSFYSTASAYSLTLNFTPYGNLSGSIYQGNLNTGRIDGLKFTDITFGSGNQTNYYLWIKRI